MDDVAGNVLHLVGVHVLDAGVFPEQAVVVAELFDPAVADAVDAAVADVADPGAFGAEQQGGGGGAHALEFAVGLAAGVDVGVGLDEGLAEGGAGRVLLGVLEEGVRDDAGRLFAGLFADRVGAHAVGHEEQVAALPPLGVVGGELHGQVVLVVAAADAHVRQAGVLDLVEAIHRKTPRTPRLRSLPVCYTDARALHRESAGPA